MKTLSRKASSVRLKLDPKHKQRAIVLKRAKVDIKIIPVVNWLNSFDGVYTLFSCEGGPLKANDMAALPYVLFYCGHQLTLIKILTEVWGYANTDVDFHEGHLRYTLRFPSDKSLDLFVQKLKLREHSK
jgi:hypothetical protein